MSKRVYTCCENGDMNDGHRCRKTTPETMLASMKEAFDGYADKELHPKREGFKADSNKPDLTLIPKDALWAMGEAFTYGAKKYGRHNFRDGIAYSRLAAACMRHLTAWMEGEGIDKESGNGHLGHALASLAMLKFMENNHPELDDRWKNPNIGTKNENSD